MQTVILPARAGPIHARLADGLLRATGIPYAQAGRWQPPSPLPPGPIDARRPAPACPQLAVERLDAILPDAFRGLSFSEDCLHLSVTAPAQAQAAPVMVWLHGGSYESAAGDMAVFDPAALVREQGVVVVAVTHRLGLLGWLGHDGRPANLGALDVIAALAWIAVAISAFGGDPQRVTLFGQSSGGDLIARLLTATAARGLFHRAIIQSAPLHLGLRNTAMKRVMRREAAGLDHDAPLPAILSRQARIRRAVRRFGLAGQMPFGPEFGAAPFPPEAELTRAHAEAAPGLPLLIGHVQDEAQLFLPPQPRPVLEPLRRGMVRLLTRRLYARPARQFAAHQHASGGAVGRYVIDWGAGPWGGTHLAELPLLFPGPDWLQTPLLPVGMDLDRLTALGAPLRRIWAEFARTGQPQPQRIDGVIRLVTGAQAGQAMPPRKR
ncbi:carboxylesterase family protein [Paracoccus jeotgali]|uniref:carboxylesterase family protein n=1 Tax=Paracoccus jeotgali TaxID=2065379 RepID=UPI0028A7CA03|nr:carboxylesterase family protein [Paracoccus jeotgali]